jgi:hypothetical protein
MLHHAWDGFIDGYTKSVLDTAKRKLKDDFDWIFIVDGRERSGKSVVAQQCAKYVDPTFCLDRICFTPDEFSNAIINAEKFSAVVYDEAYGGMSSRAAMSEINRTLMSMLAEIGQKNLFVFIVLPCFFEIDKYAGVWRSAGLFHVYLGDEFSRGQYAFWNYQKKKLLYILGKKFYSYSRPKPNFIARFNRGYSVDEQEYRQKKLASLKAREKKREEHVIGDKKPEEGVMAVKARKQRNMLIGKLAGQGISVVEISKSIGLNESAVREAIVEYKKSIEYTIVME